MDAFAVSLGIGTTRKAVDLRSRFRLAFHFGIFQALMPILGWIAGSTIAQYIESFDHWIAFGLLGYVGINMIRSGLNPDMEAYKENPSKGKTLMMLCIATSIDAMAVGVGLAFVDVGILPIAAAIGVTTCLMVTVGVMLGRVLGAVAGKRAEIMGGLLLIGIGAAILNDHLTAV